MGASGYGDANIFISFVTQSARAVNFMANGVKKACVGSSYANGRPDIRNAKLEHLRRKRIAVAERLTFLCMEQRRNIADEDMI